MRAHSIILAVLLLFICYERSAAQLNRFSFTIDGMEVHQSYSVVGYMQNYYEDTTFIHGLFKLSGPGPTLERRGDTLRFINDVWYYYNVLFNSDRTELLYFSYVRDNGPSYSEGMSLRNAAITKTDSSFEINLDSAGLVNARFGYSQMTKSNSSGGTTHTWWTTSTGKFTSTATFHMSIKMDPTLSVTPHDPISFEVYPNPAQNLITVFGLELGRATLYSMHGDVVLIADLGKTREIDISDLRAGIYILRVGPNTRKIIVQ